VLEYSHMLKKFRIKSYNILHMGVCGVLLTLGSATIAALSAIAAYAYELPDLGNPAAQMLTPQEERKLGKEFMTEVRRSVRIIEDPVANDYIQKLGDYLAAVAARISGSGIGAVHKVGVVSVKSDTTKNGKTGGKTSASPDNSINATINSSAFTPKRKFHFFIVQDPSINAFAGPGGNIGINSGLILATQNESELAAIMAHEIAHISLHHLERSLAQAKVLSVPMAAAAIASIVLGGGATGAMMGALAGGVQHMINYTRAQEAEADNMSIKILYSSGFDVRAAPAFFARMQRATMDYANPNSVPPYLRTHPVTTERMADAENRVAQYQRTGVLNAVAAPSSMNVHGDHYYLINARLRYMLQANSRGSVNYFREQMNSSWMSPQQHSGARYGYALALMRDHQWQDAMQNIDALISHNASEPLYQMTKAQIQFATGQTAAATATLKSAYVSNPNYAPLAIQYAQILNRTKQSHAAEGVMKRQLGSKSMMQEENASENAGDTYIMLSNSAAKNGKLPEAYLYRAKALKTIGAYRQARILLQQALQIKNLGSNMQAILQDELNLVKDLEKQDKDST
jgi:beta-barrel assembly-enhancing protease